MSIVTLMPVVIAAALLLTAAMSDIGFRAIPNWVPAALAIDGLVLRVLSGQFLAGAAAGGAVFVVCVLLWRRGLMGGGDVKLLGAAATVVPTQLAPGFILAVALAGGVLAFVYIALRRWVPRPGPARPTTLAARVLRVERRRIRQCRSLPYACAIAAGVFVTLAGG